MEQFILKDGAKLVVAGGRIGESDVNPGSEGSAWLRRLQGLIIAHDPTRSVTVIDKTSNGQRFHDMRQRWDDDVIWHKPDVVCIVLGLDDAWSHLRDQADSVDHDSLKSQLSELITFHKQQSPNTQFLLMDLPFLSANTDPAWNTGQILERVLPLYAALQAVAEEHGALYVPLQQVVNQELASNGDLCYGGDDANPDLEGSMMYALRVFEAFGGEVLTSTPRIGKNQKVVFIGDSITDAGRRGLQGRPYGFGYMRLWRSLMRGRQAQKTQALWMFNRGVGGNTIRNLAFRWNVDCLGLKPDHLVVKIGINDINRTISGGEHPVTVDDYREIMKDLLGQVRKQNPHCSLTLITPFFLSRTSNPASYRKKVLDVLPDYIDALKEVAKEMEAAVVDLQALFQSHLDYRSAAEFGSNNGIDIVHPSETGALIMAEALYKVLS